MSAEAHNVLKRAEDQLHEWVRTVEGTMVSIVDVFEQTLGYLADSSDRPEGDMSFDELFRLVASSIATLRNAASTILSSSSHGIRFAEWQALEIEVGDRVERLAELSDYQNAKRNSVVWPKQVQVNSQSIAEALSGAASDKASGQFGESKEQALSTIREIDRLVCLYDLLKIRPIVNTLRVKASRMRLTLRSPESEHAEPARLDFREVLSTVLKDFAENARHRKVEIRTKLPQRSVRIRGVKESIKAALENVIDNAVKYSLPINSRHSNPIASWIDVHLKTTFAHVVLEIENWGVPIPHEEIRSGAVFAEGLRGREASRRGITGSGKGLFFSKQVIEDHAGSLEISSRPARRENDPSDYSRPFVTTVTIRLPRS